MNKIIIADTTLCRKGSEFTFKEKLEIARQLDRLGVDIIELPEIENPKADMLLIRTLGSVIKNSEISVAAGSSRRSIEDAAASLGTAARPAIRIEVPVSAVCMEYQFHMKAPKMLDWVKNAVALAGNLLADAGKADATVEFCAVDATRAEEDFLMEIIHAAVDAGADRISLCDSTGAMMPDDFADFIDKFEEESGKPIGVKCDNKNDLAVAQAIMAVRKGVSIVKTAIEGETVPLESWASMVKNCGDDYGFRSGIRYSELKRISQQIGRIVGSKKGDAGIRTVGGFEDESMILGANDSIDDIAIAAAKLGYDLSDEDLENVYKEFKVVASSKEVGAKDLDAIISSAALQVPATFVLDNYVINNGNIFPSSAQITINKGDEVLRGIAMGDGPIDAAFRAIEKCIGIRYDLDDFRIQAVTEGQEAVGSCIVKLCSNGKVYSGNGVSTDILGASIRAYISAVNKIVYEEA